MKGKILLKKKKKKQAEHHSLMCHLPQHTFRIQRFAASDEGLSVTYDSL